MLFKDQIDKRHAFLNIAFHFEQHATHWKPIFMDFFSLLRVHDVFSVTSGRWCGHSFQWLLFSPFSRERQRETYFRRALSVKSKAIQDF